MSWSLRNQMLLPLVVFTVLLVLLICFDNAALQVKQSADRAIDVYRSLAHELSQTTPTMWPSSLRSRQASHPGWQFVIVQNGEIGPATISVNARQYQILSDLPPATSSEAGRDEILLGTGGDWYYVSPIEVPGWSENSYLVCLEPWQSIASTVAGTFRRSAWFAFAISLTLILAAAWYSNGLSRRVSRIQEQVQGIAAGDLSQSADERGRDEISQLAKSINVMAAELDSMKRLVREAERARLYTQLAGGLAHELRNGIHAARLSIEMFQETNAEQRPGGTLLRNAQEQLSMTETLVRRLLGLGKPQKEELIPRKLDEILDDVCSTIETLAHHAEVRFTCQLLHHSESIIPDSESFPAAVVNLCLNAIEAAGRHGEVALHTKNQEEMIELTVIDSGEGPQPAIADSLFEPFTTTKPEGIGLGLVQVQQSFQQIAGRIEWMRANGKTKFIATFPAAPPEVNLHDAFQRSNRPNITGVTL